MTDYSSKRAGNYTVLEKLGDGGFATVYLGQHTVLEKKAAIKFLLEDWVDEQDVVNRFFDEARTMERLNDHPNIVKIIDIATIEKCQEEGLPPYFIMEFVEGRTLEDLIKSDEGFTLEDIAEVMGKTLSALQHCHDFGVVHRDIKPSNIMLTTDGKVKLTDFGIAKATMNTSKTGEGLTLGSTDYMSPEQALGKRDLDYRTDIYSLGVTLYQMVCDKLPFTGDSPNAVALKHIQEPAVPPIEMNDAVPVRLNNIILKAMEKDKELRYQSCNEMLEAFSNLDGPEPNVEAEIEAVDLTEYEPETPEDEFTREREVVSTATHSTTRKFVPKPPQQLIVAIRGLLIIVAFTGLFLGAFKVYNSIMQAELIINTVPAGAKIILNGETIGSSPVQLPVPPMGYKLTLSLDGYKTSTMFYEIPARKNFEINYSLKKDIPDVAKDLRDFLPEVLATKKRIPAGKATTKKAEARKNKAIHEYRKQWSRIISLLETHFEYEEVHLELIKFCKEHDMLDKALERYSFWAKEKPCLMSFIFAGLANYKSGNQKEALKNYNKAWAIDSNNKLLLNLLGEYFHAKKEIAKAKQYFEMSLFLYPDQEDIERKLIKLK